MLANKSEAGAACHSVALAVGAAPLKCSYYGFLKMIFHAVC